MPSSSETKADELEDDYLLGSSSAAAVPGVVSPTSRSIREMGSSGAAIDAAVATTAATGARANAAAARAPTITGAASPAGRSVCEMSAMSKEDRLWDDRSAEFHSSVVLSQLHTCQCHGQPSEVMVLVFLELTQQ